eukprot:867608-Pelagomonas_calceolata.AAC.1
MKEDMLFILDIIISLTRVTLQGFTLVKQQPEYLADQSLVKHSQPAFTRHALQQCRLGTSGPSVDQHNTQPDTLQINPQTEKITATRPTESIASLPGKKRSRHRTRFTRIRPSVKKCDC